MPMPDDLTPNADELSATTDKTGSGTVNGITPPCPPAEPRSTESLHDDALKDTASNEDDDTQAS